MWRKKNRTLICSHCGCDVIRYNWVLPGIKYWIIITIHIFMALWVCCHSHLDPQINYYNVHKILFVRDVEKKEEEEKNRNVHLPHSLIWGHEGHLLICCTAVCVACESYYNKNSMLVARVLSGTTQDFCALTKN